MIFLSVCPGDLFDMLLPMLSIYQEYVRNHHYSLQVEYNNEGHNLAWHFVYKSTSNYARHRGTFIF